MLLVEFYGGPLDGEQRAYPDAVLSHSIRLPCWRGPSYVSSDGRLPEKGASEVYYIVYELVDGKRYVFEGYAND